MAKTCRGCGREFAGGETFCPVDGSRLTSSSQAHDLTGADPLIGTTLDGRYRLLRAIGEGGMGVVYEAEHVLIEKRVAIKVLRESFTRRPDVVERFRQEAKSASKIGHPNIVDVSDFGDTPSRSSYIVMEMLKGEDLADVLSRECALAPTRAVTIIFQVGRALAAAHRKGIIHRDLKPENIYLIEREGQPDFVKVVDFGVAKMSDIETLGGRKLTRTGMIFGTPEYMSPEHAGGKSLDHRVDIYALGVILYELLTGRVPFEGDNFMEVLSKHGHDPVPDLRATNPGTRVSPELERVVSRALEKDPALRYQRMEDMVEELRGVPELPRVSGFDALMPHLPPDWARSAPPAPPSPKISLTTETATTSTSPVESRARVSTLRARLPHRPRLVVAGIAVLAAAVAVVVWPRADQAPVVTSLSATTGHAPERPAASADTGPTSTEADGPPGDAPAAPAGAVPAAPASPTAVKSPNIEVRLRTQPPGARVRVDGLGEVCAQTPCTFEVARGREITLRAQSTHASAVRTFTFDDATELELRLVPPPKRSRAPHRPESDAVSDLKVPAAFR